MQLLFVKMFLKIFYAAEWRFTVLEMNRGRHVYIKFCKTQKWFTPLVIFQQARDRWTTIKLSWMSKQS